MPAVAVAIVNWNAGAWLGRCLQALQAQTFSDFVAVIVDNASTDGSERLVEALHDPRFRLVRLDRNAGFAAASNAGVNAAGATRYVALLNPDAFPAADWLEQLVRAAEADATAGALGCHLVSAQDPQVSDGTGDLYHLSGRAWRRDHGARAIGASRPAGEVFAPCAAAALYRRDAWDAAGGLDEDFFCYMEDVDLAFRLRLAGWRCVHVPLAVCAHVGSASTGRHSDFTVYHGQRNLVWVFVKDMPGLLFWLLLPLHVLLNLGALALFARRGQLGVVARAKRDALRALPAVWAKRRTTQSRRKIALSQLWHVLDKRLWPNPPTPS